MSCILRCAGLDVHQATVVATARLREARRPPDRDPDVWHDDGRPADAARLLQALGVTHVALESTGVYWKPVYYVLEDAFFLLLINMQELKHVPGRKTDVQDSEWLAQLLECGLLKASFVPPPEIRDLRDLTRYRGQQARDRTQEVNRLCKVLEDAGVKLTSVVSDVMGGAAARCSPRWSTDDGRRGAGRPRAGQTAQEVTGTRRALEGRFRPHHAFLIEQIFAKIDFLDETIQRLTAELDRRLGPFEPMLVRWIRSPASIERPRRSSWLKPAAT